MEGMKIYKATITSWDNGAPVKYIMEFPRGEYFPEGWAERFREEIRELFERNITAEKATVKFNDEV